MSGGMEDASFIGDMCGQISSAAFELSKCLRYVKDDQKRKELDIANAAMRLRHVLDEGSLGHRGDRIDVVKVANEVLLPRYRIRLTDEYPRTYVLEHRVQTEVWE